MSTEIAEKRLALFPASFDPLTNGHLDLIHRAQKLFDEVVVALAVNVTKSGTCSEEERLEMLEAVLGEYPRVRVERFEGLVVDYARKIGACSIIRGLRAMSDFEYEFEMALMNRRLQPEIETFLMLPAENYSYLSSRLLREIAEHGGSISGLVPKAVERKLLDKFGK